MDTVEEIWFEVIAAVRIGVATTVVSAVSPQVVAIGASTGIQLPEVLGRSYKVELVAGTVRAA
jgi:hypothetical protein